ncbi:MAG TPA: NAD(P)/FAD-dependent oxidoreductase [Candidatus Binatia bacterium]|nr:NAD(P)/FAD-dependent oxidoreductase [Candidatus Binatia bacterium]
MFETQTAQTTESFPIVIVGSGFSGIAMGVMLKKAGIDSFTILEKADDIGGTWRDNTYPGAACDVPSHLYSFSFEPKPDWSSSFSPQQEIQDYLRHCVAKYDLARHMRFAAEVEGAEFDESSGTWTVRVKGQAPLRARAVVLGNGALSIPSMPAIAGLDDFAGKLFHFARWDHGYDLEGKKVAVIGTGASAIQFVPQIAPKVAKLSLFQRTAPWIVPKGERRMRGWEKALFRLARPVHWLYRAFIYWLYESRALGFIVDPRIMRFAEKLAKRHLDSVVADPALRAKLTPSYTMGCKRILMSNDFYPALVRPNVDVVTEGIERITRDGVRTRDGVEHAVDAIICGTGFSATEYLAPLTLIGRNGRSLNEVIRERPEAYLGITVSGFPNLFLLMGPNTGLGHNSMIFMIEAQARYAQQAIAAMRRKRLRFIDVLDGVQSRFNQRLQSKLHRTVWSAGCKSWYLKDGHNATLWPGFTFAYWWRTRQLALGDYEVVGEPHTEAYPAGVPASA